MKAFSSSVMIDLAGYLNPEQIERVLDYAQIKDVTHRQRNYTFFVMLARTGRRITEILRLNLADIDFDNKNIRWNILKKRNNRSFQKVKALDSDTFAILLDYINSHKAEIEATGGYVFPFKRDWARKLVLRYCYEAGFKFIGNKLPHPHHFRHSFAVNYLKGIQRPEGLRLLQQELEHSNINITATYLQFDNEEQRKIKEALFKKRRLE